MKISFVLFWNIFCSLVLSDALQSGEFSAPLQRVSACHAVVGQLRVFVFADKGTESIFRLLFCRHTLTSVAFPGVEVAALDWRWPGRCHLPSPRAGHLTLPPLLCPLFLRPGGIDDSGAVDSGLTPTVSFFSSYWESIPGSALILSGGLDWPLSPN